MSVTDSPSNVKSVAHKGAMWQEGFTQYPNLVFLHGDLSIYATGVYLGLLHYARQSEECWPGQTGLATKLGISERTVRDALLELEVKKFIEINRRGQGQTNIYRILESAPEALLDRQEMPIKAAPDAGEVEALEVEAVEVEVGHASHASSDLQKVYDHWRTKRGRSRSNYDRISDQRRAKIRCRLREFTADELCTAIDNVDFDPWDERAIHDDISVIFRSHDQVERFLEMRDTMSTLDKTPNGSKPAPNWRDLIVAHDNGQVAYA